MIIKKKKKKKKKILGLESGLELNVRRRKMKKNGSELRPLKKA